MSLVLSVKAIFRQVKAAISVVKLKVSTQSVEGCHWSNERSDNAVMLKNSSLTRLSAWHLASSLLTSVAHMLFRQQILMTSKLTACQMMISQLLMQPI
jgi:hypothetical protein